MVVLMVVLVAFLLSKASAPTSARTMQSARLREPGGHILTQLKDEHEMLLKTGDKDAAVQRKVVRIVVRANVLD